MVLLASFNGGVSDAEAGYSFLAAVLAAVVAACLFRSGCLGAIFGALIGAAPAVWFLYLSRTHRTGWSDLILFIEIPVVGLVGGIAGLFAQAYRGQGKPRPAPPSGVRDQEFDAP
jgi:hypothetical protein